MMNMERRWFVLVSTLALLKGQAGGEVTPNDANCIGISRGRHFIVGFTDNIEYEHLERSRELFILVVAYNNTRHSTRVTVSSKHKVRGQPYTYTFVVEPGGFERVQVPVELTMTDTERSFKSIDILATNDVSAFGLMHQDRSVDAFLGIPTNNLGMRYAVVMPRSNTRPVHFAVIGSEDSTQVWVTLQGRATFDGVSYSRGDVLNFTVDYQEAVQVQEAVDLTGTLIQADKPVVVFSGSECQSNLESSCDTLTEQLVPVKSWGREHIYTASRSTDTNRYYIVSYFPGTVVSIPNLANQTLGAGDSWEGLLQGSGLVTSSNPILMMQQLATIDGSFVDPSLIHVPAVEHFGYTFGFTTPYSGADSEGYFNFITIVVKRDSRQTVYVNNALINETGDVLSVVEHDVPETDYVSVTIQVPQGEGVYYVDQKDRHSSSMSVIVYGYKDRQTYGYAAGLSLPSKNRILRFTPSFLREFGGEKISITVPCIKNSNSAFNVGRVKCTFLTGIGDVVVSGDLTSPYTLDCITPAFYKNGLATVHVSLDDGATFPYSGVVYIPSEEDLPPLVTVKQMNSEAGSRVINLTSDDPIVISWDPMLVGDGVSHITIMVQVSGYNNHGYPVLMEGVLVENKAPNNGVLHIPVQDFGVHIVYASSNPTLVVFFLTQFKQWSRQDIREALNDNEFPSATKIYSGVMYVINYASNVQCADFDRQLTDVAGDLKPCPCTAEQAKADFFYSMEANSFNLLLLSGAEKCFRSTTSSSTGSGQECCYDDGGDILFGPPGGGTADRYGPGDHFWFHQWYDVLPWLGCCQLSSNCDEYYEKRPSDDCSEYVPPRLAGGVGGTHITSIDGKTFTFSGAGEFLMASSSLHNLTFQSRVEVYRDTDASVYTAVVIQTKDSAKVQVQLSNLNETLVLVDGEPLLLSSSSPIRVQHHKGLRVSFNQDLSEIRIAFRAGVAVIVYVKAEVLHFIAQLDAKFKGQIKGLLGNVNGDLDDDFHFPNGSTLNTNTSLYELRGFGLWWLVAEADSIFTYLSPYDYKTYHFPDFSPNFVAPDSNNVSQEIKSLCSDSFECTFDAVATGSLSFANETLELIGIFDNIQKFLIYIVSCGFPGEVENGMIVGLVYLENSTIEVACDEGFDIQGSASLWCQGDGQWFSDLPLCVESGTVGMCRDVVLIVLAFVLIIFALTVVVFIFLKRHKQVTTDPRPVLLNVVRKPP